MENKMMVMRRALRDVSRVAEEMTRGTITGESVDRKTVDAWAKQLCEIISRDLAIPLRNCDVGTAEERMYRYNRLRDEINERYKRFGEIPPSFAFPTAFEWEDRPYEEGGDE